MGCDPIETGFELLERISSRSHGREVPALGTGQRPASQAREQTSPNHTGLAGPGRPHRCNEAALRSIHAHGVEQSIDQTVTAEEVITVGLLERPKALVGVGTIAERGERADRCTLTTAGRLEPNDVVERLNQLEHRGEPLVGLLRRCTSDHLVDRGIQFGPLHNDRRNRVMQLPLQQLGMRPRFRERQVPGERLVEDDAQSVHVGRRPDRQTTKLLG